MIHKIGLIGATGRMGREVTALLEEGFRTGDATFEITATIDSSGRHGGETEGWIDFSRPEATLAFLETATEPVLVATTGFTPEQRARLASFASRLPLLIAPNTSPGVAALMGLLRHVPRAGQFQLVVEEAHHAYKKDAPSGTAKALVAALAERGYGNPPVHSIRAGGLPGDHTIRFVAEEEELVLTHRAWNRRVFARGALEGMSFLLSRKEPGLYTMDDVYGARP